MARISLELPDTFQFTTKIPVRITDLNYGGHVGNDTVLSIIHEGRMQFLQHYGFSEKNFGSAGMIMGDVAIVFKNELFYGDVVHLSISVTSFEKVTFEFVYKLEKELENKKVTVALAKTGMVYYDYEKRKVVAMPSEIKDRQWSN